MVRDEYPTPSWLLQNFIVKKILKSPTLIVIDLNMGNKGKNKIQLLLHYVYFCFIRGLIKNIDINVLITTLTFKHNRTFQILFRLIITYCNS